MCNISIPFLHPTARESDCLLAKGKQVNPPNLRNNIFFPRDLSCYTFYPWPTYFPYCLRFFCYCDYNNSWACFFNRTFALPMQINCATQDRGKMSGFFLFISLQHQFWSLAVYFISYFGLHQSLLPENKENRPSQNTSSETGSRWE